MAIQWRSLPYSLTSIQKKKIADLLEKYGKWIKNFSKDKCVNLRCPRDKDKQRFFHIYLCKYTCIYSNDCKLFSRKIYLCRTLRCPQEEECFEIIPKKKKNPNKAREKKCRKIHGKEKILLDKKFEEFFLNYKIMRGLKIDPLKTIKFLKKRAIKNGKVQAKKSKEEGKGIRKTGKKKVKKNLKRKRSN